jgi:signal transduction histidine kinase
LDNRHSLCQPEKGAALRHHILGRSLLPALLVVALGVTGVVSMHGYKASRDHRAAFEKILAAYVSFMGERAQLATEGAIDSCGGYWLGPVIWQDGGVNDIRLDQTCGEKAPGRFELDLAASKVVHADGAARELAPSLLKAIPQNPDIEQRPGWSLGTLTTTIDGRSELVSYVIKRVDNQNVRAVGIVAVGALDAILNGAIANIPLPKEFGTEGRLTDFFYFGSNKSAPLPHKREAMFLHRRDLRAEFGGIAVDVGLRPAGLFQISPSGLPRQRGIEFLALFGLAAALVVCSVLLLRREEQLARTRANFVSGISHELRTPLAQIRMFAEMLLLGRVRSEGDRRRSLEIIDTEARRLAQLVENVLQVARSENGHLHVNPTNMRLAPIVRECVESFSVLAQARSIQFRAELQEDLVAPVDSAALRQIVLNLLDNAAKYGPVGQRVIAGVGLFEHYARIWVDDEGAGVPARERERVFDPFYRMKDAQHTTGSGIGLSVVRELVALHGGEVWIEDAPDAGARVVVQFPGAYLATAEQSTGDIAVA